MTEDDRAAARQLVLRHGWNAVAYQIAHGRRFYNFRGLEAFKASLEPMRWEPVYAIAPAGRITPWMLRAVAGAFSHGSPELLVARALGVGGARRGGSRGRRVRALLG